MRYVALESILYPVPSLHQLCVGPWSGEWSSDEGQAGEGRSGGQVVLILIEVD